VHEGFICYIWQFQYFDKRELKTSGGEKIEVLQAGLGNTHAGPDFSNAKVKIDGIDWVGSVEIHPRSSGWMEHRHDLDPAYENVVLHVVWQNDQPIYRLDKTLLPTLELKDRVDESLITQYKKLVNTSFTIPCKKSFSHVGELVKRSMLDRTLMQRLETKAAQIVEILNQHNGDWQQTSFILLARNFGFKVNSDPFSQLAQSLPYKTILKHADKQIQIEALLFGQAGMLETKTKDEYITSLYQEYHALAQKYSLKDSRLNPSQWRFLRLRPANFPTVRIAQFASMLYSSKNIFSQVIAANSYTVIYKLISAGQSVYWNTHYRFGKKAKGMVPDLGETSVQNILINTVAPLLVAYGKYKDEQRLIDKAVEILQQLPGEQNKITRLWTALGLKVKTAFDSQAVIELYNEFCQKRQCLNCSVGTAILKPKR